MSTFVVLYLIGAVLSWICITGWLFADQQGDYPTFGNKQARYDLGNSTALGFFYALFWPLGLPLAYCVTGFAQHGWRLKGRQECLKGRQEC